MATALSDIICSAQLSAKLSHTIQGELVAVTANEGLTQLSLTSGTTADKADQFYMEINRALTSASNDDLDLFDFAVFDNATDLLGNAVSMAEVVGLYVKNQPSSIGNLVLGGETSAAAWNSLFSGSDTSTLTLHPGGFILVAAPDDPAYAVADASNHLLRINASGGNITYDIGVMGRSA